jgi:Tol biopolymer transport system component
VPATALAVVAAASAAGLAGAAGPPGGGGTIVIASNRAPDLGRTMFTSLAARGPRRQSVRGFAPQGSALAPDGRRYTAGSYTQGKGGRLLVGTLGGAARRIATSPYEITEPAWSPDGRRIAYEVVNPTSCGSADPDHHCVTYDLWVVGAGGGTARRLASPARFPVWSPDGRLIAFAGHFDVYGRPGAPTVVSARGGSVRRLSRLQMQGGIAWSPAGRMIAFVTERGAVAVASLGGASARGVARGGAVTWLSNETLVVARPQTGLEVVRRDGRVLRSIATPTDAVEALSRSPGGAEVAYVERNGEMQPAGRIVAVVGVSGGRTRELLRLDPFAIVAPPAWSRSGSSVLVATTRTSNDNELYTMRPDGGDIRQLTNDDVDEIFPAVSPTGRIVFTAATPSGELGLFTIGLHGGAREVLTRPPPGAHDIFPSWSRDGERIAFVRDLTPMGPPAAELWTIRADGTDARRLYVCDDGLTGTTWSSDGSEVVFGRHDLKRPAIWAVGLDGGDAHELTAPGGVTASAWSMQGNRLAFVLYAKTDLVVLDLDSGAAEVVATDAAWVKPAWSPDDSRIAFLAVDDHVHSVSLTGGDEVDLTPGPARENGVDWSRTSD